MGFAPALRSWRKRRCALGKPKRRPAPSNQAKPAHRQRSSSASGSAFVRDRQALMAACETSRRCRRRFVCSSRHLTSHVFDCSSGQVARALVTSVPPPPTPSRAGVAIDPTAGAQQSRPRAWHRALQNALKGHEAGRIERRTAARDAGCRQQDGAARSAHRGPGGDVGVIAIHARITLAAPTTSFCGCGVCDDQERTGRQHCLATKTE